MAIKKKDFSSIKKKFSTSAKYKPQRFFDLGEDFLDAVGLPGPFGCFFCVFFLNIHLVYFITIYHLNKLYKLNT